MDVINPHNAVTKCEFTLHPATPDWPAISSAKKNPRPTLELRTMSRRNLTYTLLVITSVVVSACSMPTAPAQEDTACRGGTIVGTGRSCE